MRMMNLILALITEDDRNDLLCQDNCEDDNENTIGEICEGGRGTANQKYSTEYSKPVTLVVVKLSITLSDLSFGKISRPSVTIGRHSYAAGP